MNALFCTNIVQYLDKKGVYVVMSYIHTIEMCTLREMWCALRVYEQGIIAV